MNNSLNNDDASQLIAAARAGDLREVRGCLTRNCNVNVKDEHGSTALHAACAKGNTEIAKLLLSAGADPNSQTSANYTPLMAAARGRSSEIVRLLIQHGADINAIDQEGRTPLMCALSETPHDPQSQMTVAANLISAGASINARSKKGGTALMKAAWFGLTSVVPLLLENAAQIDVVDEENRTAADLASIRGHKQIVEILEQAAKQANPSLGFFARWFGSQK